MYNTNTIKKRIGCDVCGEPNESRWTPGMGQFNKILRCYKCTPLNKNTLNNN